MPPPELMDRPPPASAGQLLLEGIRAAAPMSRHTGPRAELSYWRARVAEHREAGETAAEREAAIALGRLLSSRGLALEEAAALARRALSLGDDAALRTELAGWLAGLGEPATAAAALRGVCDGQRPSNMARTLVKIAVLLARASDAAGAVDALEDAGRLDPADAMATELLGTIAAWASDEVAPEAAARAYLEAARRREAAREKEAAFEDRLRAFEMAPHEEAAAKAIAAALSLRGRAGAADEVLRAHAASLTERARAEGGQAAAIPERASDVHRRRLGVALKEGDAARAVGCLVDAALEANVDGEGAAAIDEVLGQAGLHELVAARLELRAEQQAGSARSETYEALARLYAGPLASPDRAVEAWIEAAASDPGNGDARAALRDHAATLHDVAPLVEALVRIGEGTDPKAREDRIERLAALREVAAIAEERIGDPGLAAWAFEKLKESGADAELAAAGAQRNVAKLRAQDEALAAALRALRGADTPEGRNDALRRLVVIYRGRPGERAAYEEALAALSRALPSDRGCLLALDRLSRRTGDGTALESVVRERLADAERRAAEGEGVAPSVDATQADTMRMPALTRVELVRTRLLLAAIGRRREDEARALEDVMPLLVEAPGHRGAASAALLLATRTGHARARADALVQLAGPVWPGLRAVFLAVAAELYGAVAEPALARRVAELACEADPSCARATATLAGVVAAQVDQGADRAGAAAIERAITTVLPRGALCDGLARALEALGELPLALGWTQRWLALRPGCPRATGALIRRAARAGDAARLSDALAWVLAQPKPLGEMVAPLTDALHALYELDPARSLSLSRRSLDVFGPGIPLLRERLLELAARAEDAPLAVAVLERWLAADPHAPHATELLLVIADCRLDAGDREGAAYELARAAAEGADPEEVIGRIQRLEASMFESGKRLGSDGMVALAEAKARALGAKGDPTSSAAAVAWRELGSLLWDLADDRSGAEDAFFRASELGVSGGVERYARDLCEFAGAEVAIDALVARASAPLPEGRTLPGSARPLRPGLPDAEGRMRAGLLVEAANLAYANGLFERALATSVSAIDIDASRADAVAVIEKSAHVEGGVDALDRTYRRLADAALGCYGRRAAHYRAARQLERRGAIDLAVEHAVACFEAVPSEGTAYVLLARLAERAGDPSEAVRAIERVAATGEPEYRNGWLKRAAALAGRTEEGVRLRLDLLLRALHIRPDPATVEDIGAAIQELVALTREVEVETIRFERAVTTTLSKLDGPEGARAALAMARVAVRVLGAPVVALVAIERAMLADGDVDEFQSLLELVPDLAREKERASVLLAAVYAAAMKPHASVGPALLRWASKLADALDAPPVAAALLVEAARRAPEDDALASEAELGVQRAGDDTLKRALDDALPVARRLEALLHLADKHERDGENAQAIEALERALATGELQGEARDRAATRLRQLYAREGRADALQAHLQAELGRTDLADPMRIRLVRELSGLLSTHGDAKAALDAVVTAAYRLPMDEQILRELVGLARRAGDRRKLVDVLTRLLGAPDPEGEADAGASDASRLLVLRELAPLVYELGDRATAVAHYEAIARLDPADARALEILEQDASERGDYAAVAALLARRIAAAPSQDTRRALRLRRAAVLEQRLGLLDEACAELEALRVAAPDDVSALRFLADIHERLGASLRAAPIWCRLGDLAATTDEKAEYGLRACSSYLAGGDVDAAKDILEAVSRIAAREAVIQLRVEIARREGDARALADALDQLASASNEVPERRAALLVEAARATAAVGDDASALDRARRAAKLAPAALDAILEVRRLEYRLFGTGTPREAQAAVEDLHRVADRLAPEQIELHAFLLAETLDVIQGHGAGMRELARRHAEIGPVTLVALGMAERLALKKNFQAALPLFERALGGDLQGMRARGRVALAAAQTAQGAGDFDAAARLLEEAAAEPETRALAVRRQLELVAARGEPAAARRALEELAAQTTGLDRGRALVQLAGLLRVTEPDQAKEHLAQASPLAGSDRVLNSKIADLSAQIDAIRTPAHTPLPETLPAPALPPSTAPSAPPALPVAVSPGAPPIPAAGPALPRPAALPIIESPPASSPKLQLDFSELSDPLDEPLTPTPVAPGEISLDDDEPVAAPAAAPAEKREGRASTPSGPPPLPIAAGPSPSPGTSASAARLLGASWPPPATESHEEASLFRELAAGSYDAGERLIEIFAQRSEDRSRDALAVRRMQAALRLGDRGALERLHAAAVADKNLVYARALEHALHAFDPGAAPVPPPSLAAQRNAPDLVKALLFRDLDAPASEALAIVWETGLYRREASQFGLTGVERVQPGPATVVGEVVGTVAGHLDFLRTAVFHQRVAAAATPAIDAQVLPLVPPAVVLRGDVREDTPELRYALGAHLAGAMPEHILVNACHPDDLRTLLAAVVAAFGPLDAVPHGTRGNPAVVRLEQNLWQLIPPRGERRLREICADAEKLTLEAAVHTSRTAMRRAGLYASGDLATAVLATMKELGVDQNALVGGKNRLAEVCAAHREIADVVRLATRMEYAEARWQPGVLAPARRAESIRPRPRPT